jgi:trehalose 6-phosphate synthase
MDRIVIVSNRLPPFDREESSAGGLAVGLGAAFAQSGATWLGWDGTIAPASNGSSRIRQSGPHTIVPLALSERQYAGYYIGFANRALWPILHGRLDLVRFDACELTTYRAVNARFAERLVADVGNSDAIWIHDYHLFLAGQELRRLGVGLPVGFFLHVPFPPSDTLSALPCHREVIGAFSAFDLVGFQTENDL